MNIDKKFKLYRISTPKQEEQHGDVTRGMTASKSSCAAGHFRC